MAKKKTTTKGAGFGGTQNDESSAKETTMNENFSSFDVGTPVWVKDANHAWVAASISKVESGDLSSDNEGTSKSFFECAFAEDPFLEHEPDPKKCDALKSSLWEMATLRDAHYFPQVSKLARTIAEKDLSDRVRTAELPVGEVCAANYASLLSEELGARVKTAPVAYHRGGVKGLFRTPLMKECFPEAHFRWVAE